MNNNHDWLLKKSLRSVDNLRLWSENPRLDPEEKYLTVRDFAEEIVRRNSDRENFINLAKSIARLNFIPGDPIVIWQNEENQRYYVAEGNRRVLILKLLRSPMKAPKSIRGLFNKLSQGIDRSTIEKIPVCVAPTFEDAEWYISQRNSISSLQQRWSTEQQRRWIADLYEKYNGDVNRVRSKIDISESELQAVLRLLKLKELVKEIKNKLSPEEYRQAVSHHFPLTNLERFFNFKDLREKWDIEFNEDAIVINSDHESFLNAFSELIKRMLLPRGDFGRIDSRTLSTLENALAVQKTLPPVISYQNQTTDINNTNHSEDKASTVYPGGNGKGQEVLTTTKTKTEIETERRAQLRHNPTRNRIISDFYEIEVAHYRLRDLFKELKEIPLKYRNSIAASIRIFLDLAVLNYIETEKLEDQICSKYGKGLRQILLKERIEFVKQKIKDKKVVTIIDRLVNNSNQYSLDVLNGYVHGTDTSFLSSQFLIKFWDFLFPLFEKLVVIKETEI